MPKSIKNWKVLLPIIFLFFINALCLLCVYYYFHYLPKMALHAEIAIMHEKNLELAEAIADTLKKQAEQIKPKSFFSLLAGDGGSSSINPYVKYLCGCASAVVVILVCVKVWPALFIAIKSSTLPFPYFWSYFGYTITETLRFRTVSSEGTSYDWLVESTLKHIEVFIKFTAAPDTDYLPLHIFIDMLQKCADQGKLNSYFCQYLSHLVDTVDATATASQVLPIF